MKTLIGLLLAALATAACNAQVGGSPGVIPTLAPDVSRPPVITVPPTMSFPIDIGQVQPEIVQQAIAEAAAVAGVAADQVSLTRADRVTWSDGSLGCPEPGMMYTQALVDGFWVVITAAGETYDIHASDSGHFVVCPPARSKPPIEP